MSEKEKEVVEKLKEAIPKMSDFDKGYILGKVENMAEKSGKECATAERSKHERKRTRDCKNHVRKSS